MKTKLLLIIIAMATVFQLTGQSSGLNLIFTAEDNAEYVRLDSIKIINLTQGGDTMLYWPDTVFAFNITGIFGTAGLPVDFRSLRITQTQCTVKPCYHCLSLKRMLWMLSSRMNWVA